MPMNFKKVQSKTDDWILRIGRDDFEFNFNNENVTYYELKYWCNYVYNGVDGFFTPPNKINLCIAKLFDFKEENISKILSHEFLHYILYTHFGDDIRRKLDNLCHCTTDDLDNSGLGKYVGWGGVY